MDMSWLLTRNASSGLNFIATCPTVLIILKVRIPSRGNPFEFVGASLSIRNIVRCCSPFSSFHQWVTSSSTGMNATWPQF
jgi:hypothetical protein